MSDCCRSIGDSTQLERGQEKTDERGEDKMENGDERRNKLGDESWRAKTITDETGGGEKTLERGRKEKGREWGRENS